ncbi:MAG: GreA/GreB family elongation factor [Candidatus Dojkabacteria bacterium]
MKKETYKITEEKKFELIEEMKNLQEVKLEEIADRLEQSRNDDFNDDDIQLGEILEERETVETRIDEISEILNNAEIIKDKDYCEPNLVAIGSTVKLKQDKKIFDVKLVSSLEADPEKNYISDKSPLGKALLKSESGDTVKVKIRGNTTEYKVLEVC